MGFKLFEDKLFSNSMLSKNHFPSMLLAFKEIEIVKISS